MKTVIALTNEDVVTVNVEGEVKTINARWFSKVSSWKFLLWLIFMGA